MYHAIVRQFKVRFNYEAGDRRKGAKSRSNSRFEPDLLLRIATVFNRMARSTVQC